MRVRSPFGEQTDFERFIGDATLRIRRMHSNARFSLHRQHSVLYYETDIRSEHRRKKRKKLQTFLMWNLPRRNACVTPRTHHLGNGLSYIFAKQHRWWRTWNANTHPSQMHGIHSWMCRRTEWYSLSLLSSAWSSCTRCCWSRGLPSHPAGAPLPIGCHCPPLDQISSRQSRVCCTDPLLTPKTYNGFLYEKHTWL